MNRTITISIISQNMPEGINGATIKKASDNYIIFLNDNQNQADITASFIHEMLHIYHDDFNSDMTATEIEAVRHK